MSTNFDVVIDRRRLKRKVIFWRVAAVFLLIMLLLTAVPGGGSPVKSDYIARITVEGVILENRFRDEMIRKIAQDDAAKALIVHVNSPGGGSTASEQLYHALRSVADQKPVVITMGTVAASGGYIAALAGDHIIARETTITGSIGVIMQYSYFGELMDKIGIGTDQVASGKMKGQPDIRDAMSDETRAVFQEMIDDSFDWFLGLVSTRRGMDIEQARPLADGRVYTGRMAQKLGLVDTIGGESQALEWLKAEHEIAANLPIRDVDKSPQDRFLEEFMSSIVKKTPFNEALSLDGLASVWQPTR